jgi:hypothetical protein
MPGGRLLRAGVLALIAPAGVLIGHALTYLLAVPDAAERAVVLAVSGHGWWTFGTVAGTVLAAAGAGLLLTTLLRRPPDGGRFRRDLSSWLWPRLAACQLGLFVVIETVERAITGNPPSGDLYHQVIEHGAFAQLVVALVITGLCWCLTLATDLACVVITQEPPPHAVELIPSAPNRVLPPRRCHRRADARAPPLLAS